MGETKYVLLWSENKSKIVNTEGWQGHKQKFQVHSILKGINNLLWRSEDSKVSSDLLITTPLSL